MSQYQIAVIVGSLRKDSFNRKLANAVVKLGPPEFVFRQLQIGDLPLYNQDDDASPAASVKRLKSEISAAQGLLFVTPELQPFDSWRTEERHRPSLAPVRTKRLGRKARRRARHLAGRHRHGAGAAAPAQYPGLP
jgi:hypothetical protein